MQRTFVVALHVDHGGRTGDEVFQARAGSTGLLLLGLQHADVEHYAAHLAAMQRADPVQPAGIALGVGLGQAQVQAQRLPLAHLLQRQPRRFAVRRMQLLQPVLDADGAWQAKTFGQGRLQF